MPAVHTYHTLNDYRITTEPLYENGSKSKLGAGALVIAIFLGVGAYFYYSTPHHAVDATPTSSNVNYQAPAATDPASPDALDNSAVAPDATNTTAVSPAIPSADANAARSSTQDLAAERTVTETKSNVAPAQPAQRAKSLASRNQSTTTPTYNTTTAAPEVTEPAPVISPPAAIDPAPTSDAPTDASPGTPIE